MATKQKDVPTMARNTNSRRIRKIFGNIHEISEMPNLIEVQRESYEQFLRSDPSIGYVSGLEKTLRSAIANATYQAEQENIAIDPDDLWVKSCFVDMGPHKNRRRMRPAPQGRAYREQRHYCHITIQVTSDEAPKTEKELKAEAAKAKKAAASPKTEKKKAAAPKAKKETKKVKAEEAETPAETAEKQEAKNTAEAADVKDAKTQNPAECPRDA